MRQSLGLLGRRNITSQGRYLYTGQHKHRMNTDVHALNGLAPTIPVFERAKTFHALDCAATGIWSFFFNYLESCNTYGRHALNIKWKFSFLSSSCLKQYLPRQIFRELPHNYTPDERVTAQLTLQMGELRTNYTQDERVTAQLTLQMGELPRNLHSRWESYRKTYTPDERVTAQIILQMGELPHNLHSRWESYRTTYTPDKRI
jgi:hypothetical protein